MRIPVLLLGLLWSLPLAAPGQQSTPGARQDAEAAREKLLKAEDQLENVQANSETTRLAVDGVKTDVASLQQSVTKLQNDNGALKQQLADLQAAFDSYKADQARTRQALIDNVADMIAAGGGKSVKKKKDVSNTASEVATISPPAQEVHATLGSSAPELAPPQDSETIPSTSSSEARAKAQKGYYHVVAKGETVTAIAEAYRDSGVKVTAAQIRKANGLTSNSELKVGEKLFIPRPDL